MAIVASLLDTRSATAGLRRAVPRRLAAVRSCRSAAAFLRLVERELVDVGVLGFRAAQAVDLARLRARFPVLPIVVYGALRPDQAPLIETCHAAGVAELLVDGVDDPMVGEAVIRNGYLARRRHDLADLARRLRLTERLQRATLDRILGRIGSRWSTASLAESLGLSREHLSRQFSAGGAPNLKRVIDLLQVLAARDLLASPGYSAARVAHLLGFANESHLRTVIQRVARLSLREFRRSSPAELQRRFIARGTRSRG
jgi:AraC-like DNA-binding protein